MQNPNYPRPKHARYLNTSQFRVHEPVGMTTPVRSMKIVPSVSGLRSPTSMWKAPRRIHPTKGH
jgi:hypothetical protein